MVILREGDAGFGVDVDGKVGWFKTVSPVPSVRMTSVEYGEYRGSEEVRCMVWARMAMHRAMECGRWLLYVDGVLVEDHRMGVGGE